jgi:PAS domain S-box-containing protein
VNVKAENADSISGDERTLIDETLRFVAERTWRLGDSEFFYDLVKFLSETLGLAFAFCDMIDAKDNTNVQTLALYAHGEITENISYSLKDTPCENVIGRSVCCYVEGVQQLFPKDQILVDMNAESYAGVPLWSADGKPLGLVAVMDDKPLAQPELVQTLLQIVAVRAGAELERLQYLGHLQKSEGRFADFASVSSDWFWELDEQLRFCYFSEQYEEISGVSPKILLGRTREEVGAPDADPDAYREMLKCLAERRPFRDFEHTRVKPDGELIYLAISAQPAFDEHDNFIGFRGIGRNISKQKMIERELIENRDAANKANMAKSQFLASMSHELRTPLNAVLGFSQMLHLDTKHPLTSAQKEYADAINSGGNHLLELVNDILDLAKVEAEEDELLPEDICVSEIIGECVTLTALVGKQRGITVIDLSEDGPGMQIRADRRRLKQAILNLLSNAVNYNSENGTVTVESERVGNGMARISVIDTGIGIAADNHSNLFQMFHRVDSNPMTASEGVGIGLSVTKILIERMGGRIDFESKENLGSTFWVELPLAAKK